MVWRYIPVSTSKMYWHRIRFGSSLPTLPLFSGASLRRSLRRWRVGLPINSCIHTLLRLVLHTAGMYSSDKTFDRKVSTHTSIDCRHLERIKRPAMLMFVLFVCVTCCFYPGFFPLLLSVALLRRYRTCAHGTPYILRCICCLCQTKLSQRHGIMDQIKSIRNPGTATSTSRSRRRKTSTSSRTG